MKLNDYLKEAEIRRKSILITDVVIKQFPVLYQGWECDDIGYVMESKDGSRYLLLTSHGSGYVADTKELYSKIEEYENAIKETHEALNLLGENYVK